MANSTLHQLQALEAHYALPDEYRNQTLNRLASAIGNQLVPARPYSRQALYNVLRDDGKIKAGRLLALGIKRLYLQEIAT